VADALLDERCEWTERLQPCPRGNAPGFAAAVAPAAAPGHGHELWMIAPGGRPHPMGMMPRTGAMRATLPADVAAQLREGVTLAVSVEPEGGSPTGLPTGAVIAAGPLVRT
jgi:anti-sigma-K factor RskA